MRYRLFKKIDDGEKILVVIDLERKKWNGFSTLGSLYCIMPDEIWGDVLFWYEKDLKYFNECIDSLPAEDKRRLGL